ncbi:MAG: hypothetical protein E7647_03590 [Ruminococcaceae bacterium]|nr:hypothetical protein [Oscillospiraceae bacterium]
MKFNVNRPPMGGDNANQRLDRLTSWLYSLSEALNVTLSNLGEDNFSDDARERIFCNKEEKNDNP